MGENRILRTSYFWLLFVPIAARLLHKFEYEQTIKLKAFDYSFVIDPALPFSWKVFFYGALAFSIANAIFTLRRPWFTKYENFKIFQEFGHNAFHIDDHLRRISSERNITKRIYHRSQTGNVKIFVKDQDKPSVFHLDKEVYEDEELENRAFWVVLDIEDRYDPISRLLALLFYLLGFGAFALITLQNILFVITGENWFSNMF